MTVKSMKLTLMFAVMTAVILSGCGSVKNGENTPAPRVHRERPPSPVYKRGVSYSFEGISSEADMALLAPGVRWFYNWGTMPRKVAEQASQTHNVAFIPMTWGNVDENAEAALRAFTDAHPECEYLLAFNEPNLTDQANMTPAQAAKKWPALLKIARELDLKIVSPAMNYGTLNGYGDPIVWLDEFFTQKGVSLDDISAIAIHCYMPDAAALKGYIERFRKYGKPVWMTEFCAWENIASATAQMEFMSEAVTYMELDPLVERYAWFIPKGREPTDSYPWMQLLTKTRPPELTARGKVFVNMGTCDKSVYAAVGQRIEAEHFTDCNLSASVNAEGFSRPVHFRPTTDAEGVLDIYNFTPEKWVEYQADLADSKSYTLTLRNTASEAAEIQLYIDGEAAGTARLSKTNEWTSTAIPLRIAAGKHRIRLEVKTGNCALNWLKLD